MYLKKLEIQGFKSFAHKSILEFSPGITCVVGPNGSGKSNIADAVRWVMGEQSLKVLRGKKSEDVIFAGSHKKSQLGSAEVSLYINNEDHAMPIDYSEVVITRRVYRVGEGEYFINKNPVRLQDILLLLARSNFGQRTYSVIAQGMIDSFIMASPRERKELFDEAAGVRQYQIKRDQAVHKLERTKDNLGQAEVLLQEISPRLRSLTRQVKRWERREEIEKKLRETQIIYYEFIYQDIYLKHREEENKFKEKDAGRKLVQTEIDEFQKKLEIMEKESSRGELFTNLQREYQQILNYKNNLLQENVVLKGQMEVDHVSSGKGDLSFINKKKEEIEEKIKNSKIETIELKEKIEKAEAEFQKEIEEQKNILEQYDKIENKLKITQEKLETKKPLEFSEIKDEVTELIVLQEDFIKKISETNEIESLRLIKREAEKIKDRLSIFLDKVKSASSTSPKEIFDLQDNMSKQIRKRDSLINLVNELKIEIRVKKERLDYISETHSEWQKEYEQLSRQSERLSSGSKEEIVTKLGRQKQDIENKISETESKLEEVQKKIDLFNNEEQNKKDNLFSIQKNFRDSQNKLNEIVNRINDIKVRLARLETKKEDLEHEIKEEMPEKLWAEIFSSSEKISEKIDIHEKSNDILKLKHQIELIGGIDENTQAEYQETKKRYDFMDNQSNDLNKAIKDLEKIIGSLDETIEKKFHKSFEKISEEFTKYFKILFNGGNAKLSLVKEEINPKGTSLGEEDDLVDEEKEGQEPSEEKEERTSQKSIKVIAGVEIKATPPGKKLKNINMLSGGERALSSIALICAILANNPSPFVVLDEVDAALDEANSMKFSSILEDLSKKSQFILITHNRTTMEKGKILYGVTMGDDGISKILSVKMEEAEEVISRQGNRS